MTVTSIYGLPGSIETTGRTRTMRRFSRWPLLGAGWPEMVARRGTSGGVLGGFAGKKGGGLAAREGEGLVASTASRARTSGD
jgi:hypothetical protein